MEDRPFDETLRIVTPKGRLVWVRAIGEAVRDRDGTIRSMHGAFQVISELLARESSRRLAEQLYQTLDNINDDFITIDVNWHFTFVNQEAMRLLERSDTIYTQNHCGRCFRTLSARVSSGIIARPLRSRRR